VPLFGFEGDNAREKVIVLLTMCFALAMAMLDNTVVNVALPTISRDLNAGVSGLQWIVDGYVLAFASLLLTGGILGDRYLPHWQRKRKIPRPETVDIDLTTAHSS